MQKLELFIFIFKIHIYKKKNTLLYFTDRRYFFSLVLICCTSHRRPWKWSSFSISFSLFNMSPNVLWKKWLKMLLSTFGGGAQHSSPVLYNVFCGSCKRHINPHNGQIPFLSYCSHISLKPFPRVKPLPLWRDSWGNQEEEILSNRCGVNKKSYLLQWASASKWLSIILQIHKMHSGIFYCQISLPHTDWISLRDPNERKKNPTE